MNTQMEIQQHEQTLSNHDFYLNCNAQHSHHVYLCPHPPIQHKLWRLLYIGYMAAFGSTNQDGFCGCTITEKNKNHLD